MDFYAVEMEVCMHTTCTVKSPRTFYLVLDITFSKISNYKPGWPDSDPLAEGGSYVSTT